MSKTFPRPVAITALAACVTLAACAHAPDPKPAVCDGHHRRPANPFGSVLVSDPDPSGNASSPAAGGTPARPPQDPRSFHPCGGQRR